MDKRELEIVAENLRRWQRTIESERLVDMGPNVAAVLRQSAHDAAIESGHTEGEILMMRHEGLKQQNARAIRQEELEALYGEALRLVPDSDPQDLLLLDEIGALLLDLKDGVNPHYVLAKMEGGKYLNRISK